MGFDPDTYRDESRDIWAVMAEGWEDRREWLMSATGSVNERLVADADPQPGQTFLDLASGTGDLGFLIADRVGEQGHVISTDFSPEMVEVARRGSETRDVTNVEHRVLDAERMELDDDTVDGVVCRYGYMLMADPAAALRETRRVLRDGGVLAFAVWSTPDRNPWAAIPGMTLVERGHMPPPEPGAPGIFAMGDQDRIRELVTAAGFSDPAIGEVKFDFRYANFDDLWDTLIRIAGALAQVPRAPRGRARRHARRARGEARAVPQGRWLLQRGRVDLDGARDLGRVRARSVRNAHRHTGRQVPHHVRLAALLKGRQLGHAVPRQRRVGQVVPAREIQRLACARERGTELPLGVE